MTPKHTPPPQPGSSDDGGPVSRRTTRILVGLGAVLLLALVVEFSWLFWRTKPPSRPGVADAQHDRDSAAARTGQGDYARADLVSIVFSNPVVERGIQLLPNSDGVTTPDVVEGLECHKLMERRTAYVYFAVDPSFKPGGQYDLEAELEYYDAGRGRVDLQYDAFSRHGDEGRYARTARRLNLVGSQQWKTNRLFMTDVRFENRQNSGADFRLRAEGAQIYLRKIVLRRAPPPGEGPYTRSNVVSLALATNVVSEGLFLGHDPDSVKSPASAAGEECYVIRPGPTGSAYLYVTVERSFKAAHPGPCAVDVEYFCATPVRFRIEYDGENNGQPSEYEAAPTITGAPGAWATNTFDLPFPRFRNSQNDEADFRINSFNNRLFIRRLTLRPAKQNL